MRFFILKSFKQAFFFNFVIICFAKSFEKVILIKYIKKLKIIINFCDK